MRRHKFRRSRERELREGLSRWNQHRIHDHLLQKGIEWRFNPPAASHMGGCWKRQIRTTKKVLGALMRQQVLSGENLSTLMCKVESSLRIICSCCGVMVLGRLTSSRHEMCIAGDDGDRFSTLVTFSGRDGGKSISLHSKRDKGGTSVSVMLAWVTSFTSWKKHHETTGLSVAL